MAAITQTVSFFDDGPGYLHMQSLPAGERSSFVRAACDAAVKAESETDLLTRELRALNAKLDRLEQMLASGQVVEQAAPPETKQGDDPRLDKPTTLGL